MMKERGFTFIEFIIAMAAGLAIALIAVVLLTPLDSWVFSKERRVGTFEGQAAMMRMIKEIRHIKAPDQISTFSPERLTFVDVDDNTVDFQKSGSNLLRGSDPLAHDVQSLTFTYYDETGAAAAAAADIRVVRVELVLDVDGETITLRAAERIRNL